MESRIQTEGNGLTAALDRFPSALRRAVERGLRRATALLERAVETNIRSPLGSKPPAVAFGTLANSVTSRVGEEAGQAVGSVFLAPPADVYGLFVEVGTRPHRPPVQALLPWVQLQFGLSDPKRIRAVAWAVATGIARRGTRGHFMFARALQENEDQVVAILEEEIGQVLP